MKKLTILLFSILISFSSYAGWFGNSIEGAFDMKLGEDVSNSHFVKVMKSYQFHPEYPLNLFDEENYFYKLTPEWKVYNISLQAYDLDKDIKCESKFSKFYKLLSILKKKYGEIKLIEKDSRGGSHIITTKYKYTDGSRSVYLRCSEYKFSKGGNQTNVLLEYNDSAGNITRTRESIL